MAETTKKIIDATSQALHNTGVALGLVSPQSPDEGKDTVATEKTADGAYDSNTGLTEETAPAPTTTATEKLKGAVDTVFHAPAAVINYGAQVLQSAAATGSAVLHTAGVKVGVLSENPDDKVQTPAEGDNTATTIDDSTTATDKLKGAADTVTDTAKRVYNDVSEKAKTAVGATTEKLKGAAETVTSTAKSVVGAGAQAAQDAAGAKTEPAEGGESYADKVKNGAHPTDDSDTIDPNAQGGAIPRAKPREIPGDKPKESDTTSQSAQSAQGSQSNKDDAAPTTAEKLKEQADAFYSPSPVINMIEAVQNTGPIDEKSQQQNKTDNKSPRGKKAGADNIQ